MATQTEPFTTKELLVLKQVLQSKLNQVRRDRDETNSEVFSRVLDARIKTLREISDKIQ